jgi:ATP-binding cassette subfamily B protein
VSGGNEERLNLAELFLPTRQRGLRRLPGLLRGALLLVWRAAPRELAASAALQLAAAIGLAGQVLVARELLNRILALDAGSPVSGVVPWLLALAGLGALVAFANMARTEQQRLLSELVARYAVDQILEVSTAVELLTYDSPAFHNRLQRARVNAASRPAQMANGVIGIMSALVTIAGLAGALVLIEPLFLAIVMLAYVPLWIATTRASKVVYDFTVEQTERDRRRDYLSFLLTRKEEAAELRAFGLAEPFRRRYETLYAERIAELRVVVRRRLRFGLAGGLVTSILTAGCIAVLVGFISSGRLGLAEAGAAAGALVLLAQRLQILAGSSGSLYESSLFIEDFTTFVDAMPVLRQRRPTGVPPAGFDVLRVEDVSFTYPSRSQPALDNVALEIRRGEVVALVGANGSGKTTLAKLLAGLYAPSSGAVRWDGVDIAGYDPGLVRASIGVIFQDFVKYMLSARENVAAGRWERHDDLDAVIEAAQRAAAHDFLEDPDRGYETLLGTQFFGGSDLSIGQWQRVALARAFFRDAPFLILDEPTAALDPRSEADLFDNIRRLYRDRTVLLISHRFSSVRSADRIYVLDAGRIVEQGSHDELMAAGRLYAELFTLQAGAFLDPSSSD